MSIMLVGFYFMIVLIYLFSHVMSAMLVAFCVVTHVMVGDRQDVTPAAVTADVSGMTLRVTLTMRAALLVVETAEDGTSQI